MLTDFLGEYEQKLCTPEEAVAVVKDGDWVDYTSTLGKPVLLDQALAKRRDELKDVKIRGNLIDGPIEVAECDRPNLITANQIIRRLTGKMENAAPVREII